MKRTVFFHSRVFALLLLATGCGDDKESKGEDPSGEACALDITLSGAVDFESSPNYFGCGFGTLIGNSFLVLFLAKDDGDIDIDLTGNVGPGETGTNFGAELGISHSDGRSFDALGCRIDLIENSFVRSTSNWEEYHLEGSGSCGEPAMSSIGESVTISPFEFVANAGWEPGSM